MKFKSFKGKQVMLKGKILTFDSDEYETECKEEIEALKLAKGVESVKPGRKPKD